MSIRKRNALHAPDRGQSQAGGCRGKVAFASWSDAQRVVSRDTRRQVERREPYHCRHCGGIHLGTVDPLMERVKRRPRVYFLDEEYA